MMTTTSAKADVSALWIVVPTILLVFIGLLVIYDASVVTAFKNFHDKLYFLKNQSVWSIIGFISMIFFSFFDYHKLIKLAPIILGLSTLFLILVLVPQIGTEVNGARRWINIGTFTFQPSEFTKLSLIFYLSAILSKFENYKIRLVDVFFVIFLPVLVISALVLMQPDFGTALIFIVLTTTAYFIGNGPLLHFALAIPAIIVASVAAIVFEPYRLTRFKAFLDPMFDPQGASYQIYQIIIALAAGGLFGVGLGASRSKFAFIPEVHSDAIFAIIVEETGFLGSVLLIGLFALLIFKAISVSHVAKDFSGKIMAFSIVALLTTQILFNLASIVALVPLTGIPLPFLSYGGSSLFVTLTSIGILLNIKRQSK